MRGARLSVITIALLLAGAMVAVAHHNWRDKFDDSRVVVLKGVVVQVEIRNPHNVLSVDVKDASGKVEHWWTDGPSPFNGKRAGWDKDSLKVGDEVTLCGFPTKAKETPAPVAVWDMKDSAQPNRALFLSALTLRDGTAMSFVGAEKCPTNPAPEK